MKPRALLLLSLPLVLASCGGTPAAASSSEQSKASSETASSSTAAASSEAVASSTAAASSSAQEASTLPEIDYIKVFAEKSKYTHVYAWTGSGGSATTLAGNWPGTQMTSYDANWYTYDFEGLTSLNIIFNKGSDQNKTRDLSISSAGYWWYYNDSWYNEDPLATPPAVSSSSSEAPVASSSDSSGPVTPSDLDNRHRTWYQLLVYSFADGNGDGVGDFKGIVDHLDYLKNLGIGGLWLSPVHPAKDYHGYNVRDYYSIDSKYEVGGVNFAKLIEECHKKDIKVLMDMVLNHTSDDHPWRSQHPDWYSGESVFGGSMPDLNYDNQAVRTEIKNVGKYWLLKGVDGFRCDGAAWIYGGGGSWNIDEGSFSKTRQWWSEYSAALRQVKSDVYLVGEVWTDLQYIEQFFETKMSAFNFSAEYWARDAIQNRNGSTWVQEAVGHQERVRQKDSAAVEASFLSNHDTSRFAQKYGFNDEQIKFANALNVMAPGGAFVYYGDELGMSGNKGSGYDDAALRTPMPFASGKTNPGNYMWNGGASSSTRSGQTADADASNTSSIYSYTAKVINFKNAHPALYSGKATKVDGGHNAIGVLKVGDYYVVINTDDAQKSVTVTGNYDLIGNLATNGSVSSSGSTLTIPKLSIAVLSASSSLSFSA